MAKVQVLREVTALTGTELIDSYDAAAGQARTDIRAELLRRLDPPPKGRTARENAVLARLKGGK